MRQSKELDLPAVLLPHLADIAKSEGLSDYTIEHETGSKVGDGFMSEMLSVTLVGKDNNTEPDKLLANKRIALVCKMQPTNTARQKNFSLATMFEREVFVYNRLLPLLVRVQRHYGLTEDTGFFAFPKCYVAALDIYNDESLIIMQDLRDQGYELLDKTKPVELEEAKIFVEQLGRLHGLSFVLRDSRPEVFNEYIGIKDHFNALIDSSSILAMFDSCYKRAAEILDKPEDIEFMNKLRNDWQAIMKAAIDPKKFGKFGVFGHGDCWTNNLMYLKVDEKPTKVCLLDWQFSRPASPADDLVHYLCSTTEKKLRDDYYEDLIGIYYDSLSDIVRRCECDPDKLFSFEDLKSQLGPFGVYGVIEAPLTISLVVADHNNVVDMNALAEKAEQGESNEEANITQLSGRNVELYKQRLTDVLTDARKYGWCTEL